MEDSPIPKQIESPSNQVKNETPWWQRFAAGLNEFYHAPYRQTMARAARDEEDFEIFVVHAGRRFGREIQFRDGNDVQDRRILDVDDKVVADLGEDVAKRLRQHHIEHGFAVRHADGLCALGLPAIH